MGQEEELYHIVVTLTPLCGDGINLSSLDVRLDITAFPLNPEDILLTLENDLGNTPSNQYDERTISAIDEDGAITLTKDEEKIPGNQSWSVQRATKGRISVLVHASPREVDEKTPVGARVDLRRDQGGLQGAGKSFIPLPPWARSRSLPSHIKVQWDLVNAPKKSRAIWSFGEGPQPIEILGNLGYYIWEAHFMAGPVLSYHGPDNDSNDQFGFYWFGEDTPARITDCAPLNKTLFTSMAEMFEKGLEGREPYRIFIRRSAPARGLGGSGLSRSYVLEYDSSLDSVDETFLVFLMAHEMIHNWLLIETEEDGLENRWYNEGIADFYGAILPRRFGLVSEKDYLKQINSTLVSYYTNPFRSVKERDLIDPLGNILKVHLAYSRGFTFLMKIDALIRNASQGEANLDNIALGLLSWRRAHVIVQQKDWVSLVGQLLGNDIATKSLKEMLDGEIVAQPNNSISIPGHRIQQTLKEPFELGFSMASLRSKIISDLIPESRSAASGIQEGDRIISIGSVWTLMENFYSDMIMKVERNGVEFDIQYWPRARAKVTCWEFHPVDQAEMW